MKVRTIVKRLIPFVYYLAVSFPHHYVSGLFQEYILVPFGMSSVQATANEISAALAIGVVLFLVWCTRTQKRFALAAIFLLVVTLALIYVSDLVLLVNNVEKIHYPQYALLAFLLKLTIEDDKLVFYATVFAGYIDEFQQYLTNPAHTSYLDFNDIVFNILGAGLGAILAIAIFRRKPISSDRYESRFKLVFYGLLAATLLSWSIAFVSGRIIIHDVPPADRQVFSVVEGRLNYVISFVTHPEYWETADNGKSFHVLSPLEGILAILMLVALYRWSLSWLARVRAVGHFKPVQL